jgi:hypothetical protein
MALTEFRMNWTLPNVSKAWVNNQMVIYWNSGGGAVNTNTITIPDSFYSTELIATKLQSIISGISGLAGFTVSVSVTENDDFLIFTAPSSPSVLFRLGPVLATATSRQIIDMINVPYPWTSSTAPLSSDLVNSVTSGIPNMRATDYIDITCPQLTYNMDLKDSSSAQIVRDMVARIYLDESVGSQSQVNVNYYNTAPGFGAYATTFSTVVSTTTGNVANFTMTANPSAFVGQTVYITGVASPNLFLNGSAVITAINQPTSGIVTVEYPYVLATTTAVSSAGTMRSYNPQDMVSVSQGSWDDNVNGVSPFVLYRQFPYPKQIRWNKAMPIGNITFEMFDDQGRSIQNLWSSAYPTTNLTYGEGRRYANSFSWNASILISED